MRKFETKNINDATPAEIKAYAQNFLGIPVDDDEDKAILAKVRAANEGDTIFVATAADEEAPDQTGAAPPDVEQKSTHLVGSLGRGDPKVTLTLHAEERDGVVFNRHKEVAVNGVTWLLKRGMSITIPYRVFEALNNAERVVITHSPEGDVREQVVKNTPFNIEHMPPPEEIDAWRARTGDLLLP